MTDLEKLQLEMKAFLKVLAPMKEPGIENCNYSLPILATITYGIASNLSERIQRIETDLDRIVNSIEE